MDKPEVPLGAIYTPEDVPTAMRFRPSLPNNTKTNPIRVSGTSKSRLKTHTLQWRNTCDLSRIPCPRITNNHIWRNPKVTFTDSVRHKELPPKDKETRIRNSSVRGSETKKKSTLFPSTTTFLNAIAFSKSRFHPPLSSSLCAYRV